MTSAWGHGLATVASDGSVLDTWFPAPALGDAPAGTRPVPSELAASLGPDPRRDVTVEFVTVSIDIDAAPASTSDAYLRLHLLSHLLVKPNDLNLDGIFGQLPTVVFTTAGPMHPDAYARLRPALQRAGISAHGIDKFPRLLDYVVPSRVRIADASRVRLGAHLSPGTTVLHEGFVNYNAGTLGASIMGTLSGGGTQRVTVGERALLGANSGIGISIGDDSVVEAGLYVTAGTKVTVLVPGEQPRTVKAVELSGVAGLLFRRNSLTGAVEAVRRAGVGVTLNEALHA